MIRVFLVDDHVVLRSGLGALVAREADMEVAGEASNGLEFLDHLPTAPTDVVLLDLHMAGMSGLETTQHLRDHYPDVRVLVLTLADDEQYVNALFDAGAQGYILKNSGFGEISCGIRMVAAGQLYVCAEVGFNALRKLRNKQFPHAVDALGFNALTKRETEVLQLVAQGLTNQEIADQLFTSRRTVETHRQNLLDKTQTKNTAALVHFAVSNGIVS